MQALMSESSDLGWSGTHVYVRALGNSIPDLKNLELLELMYAWYANPLWFE